MHSIIALLIISSRSYEFKKKNPFFIHKKKKKILIYIIGMIQENLQMQHKKKKFTSRKNVNCEKAIITYIQGVHVNMLIRTKYTFYNSLNLLNLIKFIMLI